MNTLTKLLPAIVAWILFISASPSSYRENTCDRTIRFYVSRFIAGSQTMDTETQLTIDPSAKTVHLYSKAAQGEANFITVIETMECTFDDKLTKGYFSFKGYIKQKEDRTTPQELKLTINEEGNLVCLDPNSGNSYIMVVDKREIIKED